MGRSSQHRGLPFAVVDNTLLSRLVALEIAEFLPWVFKQVLIPPEVKREAYKAPHKGKRRLQKLVREMAGFFVDCYEADQGVKEILKADFGNGEAAAIAQASHTDSILLIDERAGHKRAVTMQISVMRTTELINRLKVEAQVIDSVKPYYDRLQETGFYLKSSVRKQLLADVGEGE